jgi:hypothetical protein
MLVEDSKVLDEVVVIDTEPKETEVTGAVSVVDSKTLEALKPVKLNRHFKEQFRRKCYNYFRCSRCRFGYSY